MRRADVGSDNDRINLSELRVWSIDDGRNEGEGRDMFGVRFTGVDKFQ